MFEKPGQQDGLCSGFVALGVLLTQLIELAKLAYGFHNESPSQA